MIIRQFARWLIVDIVVILGALSILMIEFLDNWFQWGLTTDTDFGPYSSATIMIMLPLFIFFMHRALKNKGTIEVTDDYAYAKYAYKLQKGFVDFGEEVYYSFYKSTDGQRYIILSNENFDITVEHIEKEIDYSKQIPIPYTRKVKRLLPKTGWIHIVLSSSKSHFG